MNEQLLRAVKEHPYALLFATVSGAHLYGFPSPDSDYDLRGVHILPAEEVMGLFPDRDTIEISKKEDIELDLVTHDIQKFFGLLLKANGYVLEQLYSPLVVHTTPEHEELKSIAKNCVTRHHAHHYFGFAENQWRLFQKEEPPESEAAPVRLPGALEGDTSDENWDSRSKPESVERGIRVALHTGTH